MARRAASNVGQTPGVATMYAGATTGDQGSCKKGVAVFADVFFFFTEPKFLFLLEPMYCFAGTDVIFCFIGCRALKCFMSFLLEPKFWFAGSVI